MFVLSSPALSLLEVVRNESYAFIYFSAFWLFVTFASGLNSDNLNQISQDTGYGENVKFYALFARHCTGACLFARRRAGAGALASRAHDNEALVGGQRSRHKYTNNHF